MTTRYIKIIIPVLVIIGTAAFAGIPALRQQFVAGQVKQETLSTGDAVKENDQKEQREVLQEMSAVLHAIDTMAAVTFSGTVRVNDLADSSNSMNAGFVYSRQGREGYYRIADNEIVSLQRVYIVIAHDAKKMFVSKPRIVASPLAMPVKAEVDLLLNEGYHITRKVSDGVSEIALLNSKHASCREYRLSYDSTGRIRKADMRLSEPLAMADLKKDKLIHVRVDSWSSVAGRKDLMDMDRYLSIQNGVVIPSPAFSGYDLISDL